jgi:outer membrane lipoprotein SlyB
MIWPAKYFSFLDKSAEALSRPEFPGDSDLVSPPGPRAKLGTMNSRWLPLLPALGLLASCAQDSLSGNVYSRDEARNIQSVHPGRVVALRPVKIEGGSGTGALLGGVAGGLLGREIGGSRAGHTAGAIGGSLAGAAIGSQLEQGLSSRNGLEITVRLDKGDTVSVVQEINPKEPWPFAVGDRVKVMYSGRSARVTH